MPDCELELNVGESVARVDLLRAAGRQGRVDAGRG
jgi:hypothetical protein